MHLSQWAKSAPTKRLMCREAFHKVTAKCRLISMFNLLQGCFDRLLGVHEQERLYCKIDDVPMASNAVLPRIPTDVLVLQLFIQKTTQFVVGTVVVAGVETNLLPNVIIIQDKAKKLPLFSCAMATWALDTREL